jgi:prepilin-type N-terminal cleavage/methylation domain-containing protein/prepilin-type processing-associated H-X9-DG protein
MHPLPSTSNDRPPSTKRSSKTPARQGFTLVEMLVVITIIGLLASLTIPTFGKVRDRADRIACQSNLRALWFALQEAVGDNGGFYPNIEPDPTSPIYETEDNAQSLADTLAPYGITSKQLLCRADLASQDYFSQKGTSYEWRPFVDGEPSSNPKVYFRRGVMIPSPSRLRLISDYTPVHNGRSNHVFADGSVR